VVNIVMEFSNPTGCVADVAYGPDDLVGVPRGADFSVGVAGCEQAGQLGVSFVVAFMRFGQQPLRPIQRVGLAAFDHVK
jgi:hypothetical protein